MRQIPLIGLLVILCLPLVAQGSKEDCQSYEPVISEITGRITKKLHFGPPNYGEDPKNDAKEIAFILHLDQPICVKASGRLENSDEFNIKEIQLAISDPAWKQFDPIKKFIGTKRKFKAVGGFYHAHTGHHIRPILMFVNSICLASP